MAKTNKVADKEVNMELDYLEEAELREIQDARGALNELQNAVLPYAKEVAKRQRKWWDRVLESRGLKREEGDFSIYGRKIINSKDET
ncbi:hypothetical protein LCGC14_0981170 [marine sediment metagenome]|uniref:Uncharacterized protein n=1 Tax=marine sediment metagenome TaxID=412755 RepID=A0A0F9N8P5_9ZZZZ